MSSTQVPDQPANRNRGLTALSTAPDGTLVAADAATARVLRFNSTTSTWTVLATIPNLAPCLVPLGPCQPGLTDTAPLLRGIVVDRSGAVFVADAGQGTIWRLEAGRPPGVWHQSADLLGPEGLAGLALTTAADVLAVVTRMAAVTGAGPGQVIRITRQADGTAGVRSVISAFQPGEDPVDVATAASGAFYVALRGANALVVLDANGTESLRVVDDGLVAPTAVDVAAGRALLTSTGSRPAVIEVGIRDSAAAA